MFNLILIKMNQTSWLKFLLFICALSYFQSSAQNIIFNEEFNKNNPNWRKLIISNNSQIDVSSGRCQIINNSEKEDCLYGTSLTINENSNFMIEALFTNLKSTKAFQGINVQEVYNRLESYGSFKNYTKKYTKSVIDGLNLISTYQSQGVRFDLLSTKDKYSCRFTDDVTRNQIYANSDIASACGFVTNMYNDGYSSVLLSLQYYGIFWGGQNNGSKYFAFCVLPDEGYFSITSDINGVGSEILSGKTSSVRKGSYPNKLGIIFKDDIIYFNINDEQIGKINKQQFYGQSIGLLCGPYGETCVDKLKVISENSEEKIEENNEFIGTATGLIVSEKGYIVTNNHVIESAKEIWIDYSINNSKRKTKAQVILQDKNNDLAIIKITDSQLLSPIYNYKSEIVDVGTESYAMGFPMTSSLGEELKITDGIISSKTGYKGDISLYQISVPIQPGNSGGPLFDKKGYLIGITCGGIPSADNCGYAIKSTYLRNLLDLLPDKVEFPKNSELENLIFTEQIKKLSPFVVLIRIK